MQQSLAASAAPGRGGTHKVPLIPVFLDDLGSSPGFERLWPADGNAKLAAEQWVKNRDNTGTTSKDTQSATNMLIRHLETASETFRDTIERSAAPSKLVEVQYVVVLDEDPPRILLDRIKWDLATPEVMAGAYTARVASDLGLSPQIAVVMQYELRRALQKMRRSVEAGNSTGVVARPTPAVRKEPSRVPVIITGEAAKQFLVELNARRQSAEKQSKGDATTKNDTEVGGK